MNLFCRICGYKHLEPQWGDDDESPTYFFCGCCGVEAGNEDFDIDSIRHYRASWIKQIEHGAKWFKPYLKPENWSLEEQLKNIPVEFR